MMKFLKPEKILTKTSIALFILLASCVFFPALYEKYLFLAFHDRMFVIPGVGQFKVDYPAVAVQHDTDATIITMHPERRAVFLVNELRSVLVMPAAFALDMDAFALACASLDQGIYFDGDKCYIRTAYVDYFEFKYLDFPDLIFRSAQPELDIAETNLQLVEKAK